MKNYYLFIGTILLFSFAALTITSCSSDYEEISLQDEIVEPRALDRDGGGGVVGPFGIEYEGYYVDVRCEPSAESDAGGAAVYQVFFKDQEVCFCRKNEWTQINCDPNAGLWIYANCELTSRSVRPSGVLCN